MIIRLARATTSAVFSIVARSTPLLSTISSHVDPATPAAKASNPLVCSAMNARSTIPGAASSRSSSAFITPCRSAASPFTRTGTCRSASGVPDPSSAGTSFSGLA